MVSDIPVGDGKLVNLFLRSIRHLCIEKMPQKCKPDTLLNIGLRCLAQHIDLICYGARHVNHREKRLRERKGR